MATPNITPAVSFPRGSEWRKWDLHVHTPASIVHQYSGADPWPAFLDDLEALPSEFKVLGINDYIFLDGYKRVLEEKKKNGRLKNIDLLLPVIELRLDKFGGSPSKLSKVNHHIIFSDEVDADVIEQHFLNALTHSYQVSPQYEQAAKKWTALPTRKAIEDLGKLIIETVPTEQQKRFGPPLVEGFNNLCFSLDKIREALGSHYFEKKFVTAVGKTEWADIKWADQSIAEKKNIINGSDLVFISSESPDQWANAKKSLIEAGVNQRLLDCSDAHSYSTSQEKDRIGNCFTWIKADPTFAGLQQILNEPEGRVFVGALPPKLERVRADKTRYIRKVSIKKKPGASLREIWFNNEIPLNPGLVAIIGNKGKGKSALADTMGLLGSTRQYRAFSFLSPNSFRNPRDNKARFFEATLTWESGTPNHASLDSPVDETQPELVKYIPQNFLEIICNEIAGASETNFDKELKKVIFSHVAEPDRLGKASLDELIAFRTEETGSRIAVLRSELHAINQRIALLEEQSTPAHRRAIENRLQLKRNEVEALTNTKPPDVLQPADDPARKKEVQEISTKVSDILEERKRLDVAIQTAKFQQAEYALQSASLEKALSKITGFRQQVTTFLQELETDCKKIGIKPADVVNVTVNEAPLLSKGREISELRAAAASVLDQGNPASAASRRAEAAKVLTSLQEQLDEPNKQYQAYLRTLEDWEKRLQELIGDEGAVGTLKFLDKQLADLDDVPNQITHAGELRIEKAKAIHQEITRLADTYRTLYAPVQSFIAGNPIARERFQLNFEVAMVIDGFENTFSDFINHGVAGTFCGVDEGSRVVRDIVRRHELDSEHGAVAFLNDVVESLQRDKRTEAAPVVDVASQLRKGQSVAALYDYIFSLGYLRPRYRLRMGEKELSQLSPGERGTLLLVFYLLIDKEQIPLIIDQPEENLDNQTVFELLVPCIKETKERRQVIIVTHNPNLAVVCDAEQVVCASLDKAHNCEMQYLTGAIENPLINKAIVDILEGTRPAFDNRDSKYEVSA